MATFSLNPATVSALHLTRTYSAAPGKVRKAWSDGDQLTKWWAPEGMTLVKADFSPKVGDELRIELKTAGGETLVTVGKFQDASEQMLVFTWAREGKKHDIGGTMVTVEFRKVAKGTEVALTH